jgi:hypothetical protein
MKYLGASTLQENPRPNRRERGNNSMATKNNKPALIIQAAKAQTGHPLKNLLLIYLADYWSAKKGAYPSHTTLAERCGGKTNRETVSRLLKQMVADGWLTATPNYTENGAQKTNTYHLNTANIGVTTDHRGVMSDHRGCDERSQGVCSVVTGGCDDRSHNKLSLISPLKSLVENNPISLFGFDEFYKAYPKKAGKQAAQKAWNKLKPGQALISRMLSDIRDRLSQGAWDTGKGKQFIPNPSTYLNGGRWEDEIIPGTEIINKTDYSDISENFTEI